MRTIIFGFLAFTVAFIASCSSGRVSTAPIGPGLSGKWELTELNGVVVTEAVWQGTPPSILLSTNDSTYSGYSGCNHFQGRVEQKGTFVQFYAGPMTMKACPDGNAELQFMKALLQQGEVVVEAGNMVFAGKDGSTCRFVRK